MSNDFSGGNSLDHESEMLPQDPPPWIIRAASRLLIAMFFLAVLVAVFVRLPETVEAPFVLVPQEGADPIQSPRLAVLSKVNVVEGQKVSTGDELFVLRSDEIRGWDIEQRTLKEDLRTHEESLRRADSVFSSQLEIKSTEISQSDSEVKFREKHAESSRDLVKRMEKLSKTGGISQVELIKLRLELAESEKDHSVAQRTVQQVMLDKQKMETEYARDRNQHLTEIEKIKVRLGALKTDLENTEQSLLAIRAPYDGVVLSVAQRSPGSVVQNGQELCQLARTDAKPRAKFILGEGGLSKLSAGKTAKLFFEAYPYQRYGVIDAKIDWISPSAISSAEGAQFVAFATLAQTAFPSRRQHLPLRVGMKGAARVVVGKRTMVESVFEPIKALKENIRG